MTIPPTIKKTITTHLIALAAGAMLVFGLLPRPEPKIEYRETVKVEEKIVEKEVVKWKDRLVEVKVKDTKVKIVTKIVEVIKPGGEVVKTTEVTETDDSKLKTDTEVVKTGEKTVEVVVEKVVFRDVFIKQEPVLSQWMVSGLVGVDRIALPPNPIFGGMVQRRVIGNIWAGGWGTSIPNGGAVVSVEF